MEQNPVIHIFSNKLFHFLIFFPPEIQVINSVSGCQTKISLGLPFFKWPDYSISPPSHQKEKNKNITTKTGFVISCCQIFKLNSFKAFVLLLRNQENVETLSVLSVLLNPHISHFDSFMRKPTSVHLQVLLPFT